MSLPRTLGELRQSSFSEQRLRTRKVKDELRENLLEKLHDGGTVFPGIVGYDDTVVPQIVNAMLSRHNPTRPSAAVAATSSRNRASRLPSPT